MVRGPQTWRTVPEEPTEEMWGGLARQIVFWQRSHPHTGATLHRDLRMIGMEIPNWLAQEIPDTDRVPSKGTVAVYIYKAMIAAAPPAPTP